MLLDVFPQYDGPALLMSETVNRCKLTYLLMLDYLRVDLDNCAPVLRIRTLEQLLSQSLHERGIRECKAKTIAIVCGFLFFLVYFFEFSC